MIRICNNYTGICGCRYNNRNHKSPTTHLFRYNNQRDLHQLSKGNNRICQSRRYNNTSMNQQQQQQSQSQPQPQQQQQQQHDDIAQKVANAYYTKKKRGSTFMGFNSKQKTKSFYQRIKQHISFFNTSSSHHHHTTTTTTSISQRNINTAWYAIAIVIGSLGASYAAVPLYKVFCQTTGFGGTTQRVLTSSSSDQNSSPNNTTTTTNNNSNNGINFSNMSYNDTLEVYLQKIASSLLPAGTVARVHTWTDEDAIEKLRTMKPISNADMITIRFDTTVTDIMPWTFQPIQLDVKVVPGETALSFFRVTNHSDKAITGVATYNVHPPKVGLYFQKIQCFCFEEQRLLPHETVDMPVFFFIDPEIMNDPQVSYIRSVTLSYTFFPTDEDDDDIEPVLGSTASTHN